MNQTDFRHKTKFEFDTYRQLLRAPKLNFLKLLILATLGVVMLFSSYTLILGVVALFLFLFGVFAPNMFDSGMKRNFSESPTLGYETEYGINNQHIWIKNDGLHLQAQLRMIAIMEIKGDWMILSVHGMPQVFLPVTRMKTVGVYDDILDLLKWNWIDTAKGEQ